MSIRWLFGVLALCLSTKALGQDIRGSSDHPRVGRYEGSRIVLYDKRAFDNARIVTRKIESFGAPEPETTLEVAGRVTRTFYVLPPDRSSFEVMHNFETRLASDGFRVVFSCEARACSPAINGVADAMLGEQAVRFFVVEEPSATDSYRYLAARRDVDGEVTTVALLIAQNENRDRGAKMALLTIDSGALETGKIVVPTVEALEQGISRDGRYALYGLYFDTGRAILKPDSQPTLEAIAGLLRAKPELAIIVAGHTDNQGEFQFNVTLSQQRAAAVVAALTRTYGIAPSRLTAFGAGMSAPAASNADEAGRAKNRRVEIVSR